MLVIMEGILEVPSNTLLSLQKGTIRPRGIALAQCHITGNRAGTRMQVFDSTRIWSPIRLQAVPGVVVVASV